MVQCIQMQYLKDFKEYKDSEEYEDSEEPGVKNGISFLPLFLPLLLQLMLQLDLKNHKQ